MIGDAIAGWLGNRIDRRDGEGGTLGALAGVAIWRVGKRVVPAALVLGGVAYAVHRLSRTEVRV
jgi:hypothetical protein